MNEIRQALEQRAYLRFPNQANKEELKAADVWLEALNLFDGLMAGKVIVPVEQARKVELWDGLLSSARIRILGTAGMGSPEGEYRHFGMEIWSSYGEKGEYDFDKDNEYGKAVLEKYAASKYKAMITIGEQDA